MGRPILLPHVWLWGRCCPWCQERTDIDKVVGDEHPLHGVVRVSPASRYAIVMPPTGDPHVNPDTFNAISPYLEDMTMILEEMLQEDTDNAKRLRYSLTEISKALGTDFSVDLNVIVQAFSSPELRALPLVQIGLSSNNGDTPYGHSADCTPQRYIVDGEIQVVPRDRCPKCWEDWMNKFEYPICEHCETRLGKDCKVLLDSDLCPFCEAGHVSMQNHVCDDCGSEINLTMVTWG